MTLLLTLGKAFLVGGLICVIGQLLIDRTALTPGKILVLFVVCGVVLGGVGLYGPLADFAGEAEQYDDQTMLCLVYNGKQQG